MAGRDLTATLPLPDKAGMPPGHRSGILALGESMRERGNRRELLSQDQKIELAVHLQREFLSYLEGRRDNAGLVFHGGTNIALTHGSPRWSEDLDFMATPSFLSGIAGEGAAIERHLADSMEAAFPGGRFGLTDKTGIYRGSFGLGSVSRWIARWEHPALIGVVKIKLEFFATSASALERYETISPPGGDAVARAAPRAIWADKIVALASRPALKFRDIHDLGLLGDMPEIRDADDDEMESALAATMGIYGKTPQDILAGLRRDVVRDGLCESAGFFDDMTRWFPSRDLGFYRSSGVLEARYEGFVAAFERGENLISQMAGEAPRGFDRSRDCDGYLF